MKDDPRKALEELEKELLAQEPAAAPDDPLNDTFIREVMAESAAPAFEDPETIAEPADPAVYCNYSNDYGRELKNFAESGGETDKKAREDRIQIGLMIAASALSLGIIGILIYWIAAYL